MAQSIAAKLRVSEGMTLKTINAPANFETTLGTTGISISPDAENFDQIHWFVKDRAQMERELPSVLKILGPGKTCWIYYPKGSSGIQTDLTRDKGWEKLMQQDMQWLSLVSFDGTWSAFAMRPKTGEDEKNKKEAKPREIFNYIDSVKKTVTLPDDLLAALKKAPSEKQYFDSLAFSHRKEYVEWIITAKKEETRKGRISKMLDMLSKGAKNPADKK